MKPNAWRLALMLAALGASLRAAEPTAAETSAMRTWATHVFSGGDRQPASKQTRLETALPFSFVLGGKSSAELLPGWKKTHSQRALDSNRTLHTLAFADSSTGLTVVCDAVIYADYPAVDYLLRFENRGSAASPLLERILPLDAGASLGENEPLQVHFSRGGGNSPEDYRLLHEPLTRGKPFHISALGGRSSNTHMPWYNLEWHDGGLLVAIGWSGQWQATLERSSGLALKAGMEVGRLSLKPGEAIRTPRIVLLSWQGQDLDRSYNLWRRIMIGHYVPRIGSDVILPPVAKNTAYDELEVKAWRSTHGESNQIATIREAAGLGIEAYWLDAYWFQDFFPKGVGNWQFPVEKTVRDTFPRGLRPLADEAHRLGMKFILWFEPERVAPATYIAREKPSWTIRPHEARTYLFRLDLPDAREWMTRYIIETLKVFDVDIFRIDFNVDPLPFWRTADTEGRHGITEIRHVENLYRMWDDIIAAKPRMWIDNCASGGRRIDLETCSRSLPLWRSDFNDTPRRRVEEIGAIADQVMTMGLSLYMPFHAGPVWRPQPYYWRSAMSAGNIIYWDIRADATGGYGYDRELAKKAIAECKSLRPYYSGDYYPLTAMSADPTAWAAYQYVRAERGDGFAVFFRRPESPYPALDVRLRGLDTDGRYRVAWHWNYEAAQTKELSGAELASFRAEIPDRPGSLLLRFERQ